METHLIQAGDIVGQQVPHNEPHGKALPARRVGLVPPPHLDQHLGQPPTLHRGAVRHDPPQRCTPDACKHK